MNERTYNHISMYNLMMHNFNGAKYFLRGHIRTEKRVSVLKVI